MYQNTAQGLAALGRNGDSMLMHVNPQEVAALSHILGPVTVNPKTGLPEAYGWGSTIGSVLGGIGSFGVGASLEPIVGDIVGEGVLGDVLRKAIPAIAGAGVNAAIGGATGGKAGALGGAAQGLMSGGLGAYASEDILGKPLGDQAKLGQLLGEKPVNNNMSRVPTEATPSGALTDTDKLRQLTGETKPAIDVQAKSLPVTSTGQQEQGAGGTQGSSGFFDNLGTVGRKALTSDGFKQYSDYLPYLFQAGMIGNAITAGQQDQDAAQQLEQQTAQYALGRRLAAQRLANQTYAGYSEGGPINYQSQGPVPVSVHIPEQMAERVKAAGGLPNYINTQQMNQAQGIASFATGGYINTQQVNPDNFYPQSQIPKAQPYAAASPIRHEVVNDFAGGGLIEGDGDGMSDDIDADIDGQEEVRVADGEYLVPRHLVDMIGTDRLDELLNSVRKAAYGHDKQVRENAGLKAAQRGLGIA